LQEATGDAAATVTSRDISPTTSPQGWLVLELPKFDIPILFEETFYPTPSQGASGTVVPLDWTVRHKAQLMASSQSPPTTIHPLTATDQYDPLDLVKVLDYENEEDNPTEDKYRTLAHDLLRGLVDPALKPDRKQREQLQAIIESPSYHLTREEKDLLWRFRFSLVDHRQACSKFLLAVDWTVDSEVVQAAELLEQWRKRSPIAVTDALKLLGKNVAFSTNSLVRSYAIDTLAAAPDSELRLYLLQLVQAVKYETSASSVGGTHINNNSESGLDSTTANDPSASLATFLVQRAAQNFELANFLCKYD
jgi:phosphatidylinositol 3-kinase